MDLESPGARYLRRKSLPGYLLSLSLSLSLPLSLSPSLSLSLSLSPRFVPPTRVRNRGGERDGRTVGNGEII
jgi:hypothetical protein